MQTLTPDPTTPLTSDVTDMEVLSEKPGQESELLYETEEAKTLLNLIQQYDKTEEFVRLAQVKKWRRHMHYWNGLQYLAWDEMAHDWMTAEDILENDPQADIDPALYAKVVNVYKAHGEIFVGALTSGVPSVRFFPKDADAHDDVVSAKAHTKLAEIVQKQNRARLLLMKAIFIAWNQGLVAAYNENKTDYRFGKIDVPDYQDVPVTTRDHYCPSCGFQLGSEQFQADELNPQGPMMSQQPCPGCGMDVQPEPEDTTTTQKTQVGTKSEPKNRECIEIYGPLNVKLPVWVRDQNSTPYLILETEEPIAMMREIYPEIADKIQATSYPDTYDKEARVPSAYKNDFPREICTVQRCWLRPWAFNLWSGLATREKCDELKSKYPEGCYVVIINKQFVAEILADKLDDHWTLTEQPLSEILHAEPVGAPVMSIQDMTNELTNLTLETVEFGIPETFADSSVLDFDQYGKQESRPGQISPATLPSGGQNLGSGFFTLKPATLSREIEPFADRLTEMGQFVQGTYPSIFGGTQESGGGTAREYELSKSSALQRLATTWIILQEWWAKVIQKSTRSYAKNMKSDELQVQQKGTSFINVWIKKADLAGELSENEPEISEAFPLSWSQKREVILSLIQMKDPDVAEVIRHPENAGLIASLIGLPDLYIPGDDSRTKQLYEIAELVVSEPHEIPPNPMSPNGTLLSTVQVVPELDDHAIEAEICKAWLRSEVGLDAKQNNAAGYANVLAHLREHQFFLQQSQMMQQPQGPGKSENSDNIDETGIASQNQ